MASIFAGTEPPAWLQNIARPAHADVAAHAIGQGLGGLFNAAQDAKESNDQADAEQAVGIPESDQTARKAWYQEIPRGLAEARLNLLDPLWKVKVAQTGALIGQRQAAAELQMQKATQLNNHSQALIRDAPKLTDYDNALKSNLDAPMPDFETQDAFRQGMQMRIGALKRQKLQNDAEEQQIREQQRAATMERARAQADKFRAETEKITTMGLSDNAPEVFTKTLPSGKTVEGIYNPKTGKIDLTKPDVTPKDTFTPKEANRIRTAISKVNVQLAGEKAKVAPDQSVIAGLQGQRDALIKQLRDMQSGAQSQANTNSAVPVGRFLVKPGGTETTGPFNDYRP